MTKEWLKKAFADSGAVKRGDFTLASGAKSDVYFDVRRLTLDGKYLTLLSQYFLKAIMNRIDPKQVGDYPGFDAIGGPLIGADPLVAGILIQLPGVGTKGFLVRKEAKQHGLGGRIVGPVKPGMSCVIVEDVVTTGQSLFSAICEAQIHNLKVLAAGCVLDREEGGRDLIERVTGVPFVSLITKAELLR